MITTLREDEQHKHSNGGGWVANSARVEPSVYVGPFALVYGKADLSERVRVEDYAQVSGSAILSGDCIVRRVAWVDHGSHNRGVIETNEREKKESKRLRPAEDGL
jgi:acyl-[acyl carrier protein]--UDP-N-acetylglucosamine O-acyltransferase